MTQNSLYVLYGHGTKVNMGNIKLVPENGTMIKMIPGTCTPSFTLDVIEHVMRDPNTPHAEFVESLNGIGTWQPTTSETPSTHHPAFKMYEPKSKYSDTHIVNEYYTKLFLYHFDDATRLVSKYDITDLLLSHIDIEPRDNIPLSRVHEYLSKFSISPNYTLIVLACMVTGTVIDKDVNDQLQSSIPIEQVYNFLKERGYYGGKKSRMGQKRRTRKTSQRKTKYAMKRKLTVHNS